jgi:diguanylate cyclase (GGDEF)-like protein/PAS domain S-box-containing protein
MVPDMKTVMLIYAIINAVCTVFMLFMWYFNRKHFAGISFWLADMVLQTVGSVLILLRGVVPNFLSMTVSNILIVSGILLLYIGLQRFMGKKSFQVHNYILVAIFSAINVYFLYVQPNLAIRTFSISAITLILTLQCAWFMLYRIPQDMRRTVGIVGLIFSGYVFVSMARIILDIVFPLSSSDFFKSGVPDTLAIIFYIMLAIGLVLGLVILVNGRLNAEIQINSSKLEKSELRYKLLSEHSRTFTWEVDGNGLYTFMDHMVETVLGFHPEDIIYKKHFYELCPVEEQEVLKRGAFRIFKQKGQFTDLENKAISKDGQIVWLSTNGIPILKDDGTLLGYQGSDTDITERRMAQEELKSLARFPHENPNLIGRIDFDGKLLFYNPAYIKIFKDKDHLPIKLQDTIKKILEDKIFNNEDVEIEFGDRVFLFNVIPISEENYINFYGVDITDRKKAEEELKKSRLSLDIAIEASQIGIWELDLIKDTSVRNLRHDRIFGYEKEIEHWGAKIFFEHIIPEDRPSVQEAFEEAIKTGKLYFECRILWPDKSIYWINVTGKVIRDRKGKPQKMLGTVIDITKRKETEQEILHLSFHDLMTGLYNRRFLEEELKRLDTKRQLPLSIIMADVDKLKYVNDIYGHGMGDRLIISVSQIIKKSCREEDIIARWGGDEFIIFLPKTSEKDAEDLMDRIRKACEIQKLEDEIDISISFGLSIKKEFSEHIEDIIKRADKNMYDFKARQKTIQVSIE